MNLLIFLSFIVVQSQTEVNLLNQSNSYIDNIERGIDLDENFWALAEVYFVSCGNYPEIVRSIENLIFDFSSRTHQYFDCKNDPDSNKKAKIELLKFASIEYGLVGLSTNVLLNEQNDLEKKNFSIKLQKAILDLNSESERNFLNSLISGNKLLIKDIPRENFDLILYSLLYSYSYEEYLFKNELDEYFGKTVNNLNSTTSLVSVKSGLRVANTAFYLFNNEEFIRLTSLESIILNQHLFPISEEKLRHYKALAYSFFTIDRFDKSLELNRKVLIPVSLLTKNSYEIDQVNYFHGLYLLKLGKYEESKEIFEDFFNSESSEIDNALLFNDLSVSYYYLGEKNKYLKFLLEAFAQADANNDYEIKFTILNNLFNYYTTIGDHSSASDYLKIAEDLAISLEDNYQMATIRAFRAYFLWKTQKNSTDAINEFYSALSEFNIETDFNDYSNVLRVLSEIYIEIDSLDKAQDIYLDLKNEAINRNLTSDFISSTIGLAKIAVINEDAKTAFELINEISNYSLLDLDFSNTVKLHTIQAQIDVLNKESRVGIHNFEKVLHQVIERAKTSIDSQTGYWVQSSDYLDAFNIYSQMLIDNKNMIATLNLLDEYKTINDVALYNSPILRANKLSEEDLATDNLLNERIVSLRTQYLNETDNSRKIQIKSQIDQLSAQREDILNKLREKDRESDLPIWEIQNKIQKNELVIHFTEIGKFLYISKISKDNIDVDIVDFDYETQKFFESVANSVAKSETNLMELHQIFKKLKLDTIESNFTKVTIIPDNYLYRIPIDILPISEPSTSNSYGSTKYFIEKYEVRYFTSLKEYLTNNRNSRSNNITDFSAFAISDFGNFSSDLPTLPFATNEVQNIDATLEAFTQKNLFVESQATKESFLTEASRSQIVHVATHSEVSEQDPLFSKIYLNSSSNSEEEALYAYELFDANMNSDLIMLNSCSSGSGEYLQGSGIVGITRALRYAGANSLALNLWAVNDKIASEFAYEFYKSINEGNTKSEAMRDAKLYLLETGNANPHYWGAYMLIGNPEPLTNQTNRSKIIFPLFILLLGTISFAMRS